MTGFAAKMIEEKLQPLKYWKAAPKSASFELKWRIVHVTGLRPRGYLGQQQVIHRRYVLWIDEQTVKKHEKTEVTSFHSGSQFITVIINL